MSSSRFAPTESCIDGPRSRPRVAARLVVVYPRTLAVEIVLAGEAVVLGRDPVDPSVAPLDHKTVSRRHLRVVWDTARKRHVAEDLGSRNGARVNGELADQRVLEDGAVLRLGDVLLVYEVMGGAQSSDGGAVSIEAIPGRAATVLQLRAAVARAAPDTSPVLIVGETGTGKELVAAELHRLSGRKGPSLSINCAALSAQLVESQLFGHVRGAFTGATEAHAGLFRAANGGTLFLDELGELPEPLQPKLLRALQDGEIQPLGTTKVERVDVRVVAATNRNLVELIEKGRFRRDLYARLALWEIPVPPLRQRRCDLLDWLDRLGERRRRERPDLAGRPLQLTPDVAEQILGRPWPDNLRGLDRLVHELMSRPDTNVSTLPGWIGSAARSEDAPPVRRRPQPPSRDELVAALAELRGSVRAVAQRYGRDRRQVYRWMESLGIPRPGGGDPAT